MSNILQQPVFVKALGVPFILLFFVILRSSFNEKNDAISRDSNFKEIIGVYVLDTSKTWLGNYYNDTSLCKLTLTMSSDGSFRLNKTAPFIAGRKGIWTAKGLEKTDSSKMYFDDSKTSITLLGPYQDNRDSTLMLLNDSKNDNKNEVKEVFFRKIK